MWTAQGTSTFRCSFVFSSSSSSSSSSTSCSSSRFCPASRIQGRRPPCRWPAVFLVGPRTLAAVLGLLMLASSPTGEQCEHHFSSKDSKQGTFTSPNYPNPYPTHVKCRYFFMGTIDERVRISWEDFDLEEGTKAGCLFDYVDIFTIDIKSRKDLKNRLCGSKLPEPIVSLHLTVEMNFKSDYTGSSHKGFLGRFEFIEERWQPFPSPSPECGPDYFHQGLGGGVISSPRFPEAYPPNTECTWMIRVERDRQILINFVDLDLGQSVHCGETYVNIYNGFASADGLPAERICGQLYFYNRGVKEFTSTSFRVVIRFKSSNARNVNNRGFRLGWTAVKLPEIVEDDIGNIIEKPCWDFHCEGGEYCIDTTGILCNQLPRYCIAKSLVCNGVPNCGAYDHSDEDGCFQKMFLIILGTLAPILIISLVAGLVLLCHRRGMFKKSASQEQSLTMTLQKLERSPTASKRSSDEKVNGSHHQNNLHHHQHHLNNSHHAYTTTGADLQQKSPLHQNHYSTLCGKQSPGLQHHQQPPPPLPPPTGSYPPSPANHGGGDRSGGGGGYYHPSPHTLRMPPGRIPAYHMVVNADSDDNHSVHATV